MASDINSVTTVIQSVCPNLTEQSVCDCVRLGKYSNDRQRPILVKLARSCDAASILAKRRKLSTSNIYIKRHMSTKERSDEKIILQERRSLITSGIDRSIIKIHGKTIYVNNKEHGTVTDSGFTLCRCPFATPAKHSEPIITHTSPAAASPKGATVANVSKVPDN